MSRAKCEGTGDPGKPGSMGVQFRRDYAGCSGECPVCGQRIGVTPSGHMRWHKERAVSANQVERRAAYLSEKAGQRSEHTQN